MYGCFSSVHYSFLINGNSIGEFVPTRGLQQGDFLSPYLFILCMDILSWLLEVNQEVKGIKIERDTPAIHHLMYTNDLLLVRRASLESARARWGCLEQF